MSNEHMYTESKPAKSQRRKPPSTSMRTSTTPSTPPSLPSSFPSHTLDVNPRGDTWFWPNAPSKPTFSSSCFDAAFPNPGSNRWATSVVKLKKKRGEWMKNKGGRGGREGGKQGQRTYP